MVKAKSSLKLKIDGDSDIVLPHSIAAEQEIIGSLLHDNNNLNAVGDILEKGFFYNQLHSQIYDIVVKLIEKGRVADPINVSVHIESNEAFKDSGGVGYLRDMVSEYLLGVSDVKDRARTIKDLYLKRNLIDTLVSTLGEVSLKTDIDKSTEESIENLETNLFLLTSRGADNMVGSFRSLKSALKDTSERVNKARSKSGVSGIETGFKDLNDILHGWQNSDLVIIAGRPSMGKTSFAISVAINAANYISNSKEYKESNNGKSGSVGIFSLEMSSEQISAKILSIYTGTPTSELISGRIDNHTFNNMVTKIGEIEDMPIFIDDTPALSIGAIRTRARRLKQKYGLSILVVDYLQLLRGSSNNKENRVQEVSEVTQGLKAIAKELNVPVIALSQLSRGVEARDDKRPQLSDLRESGSIEQDADIVMFIYRDAYYLERTMPPENSGEKLTEWMRDNGEKYQKVKNTAEIIVAKHRNGPIGTVVLRFDEETTKFDNLALISK